MKITTPYANIRHLLCGNNFATQWTYHKDNGLHLIFLYAQMIKEARMWEKIIYNYLIQGKSMIDVTHERVFLSYDLMRDDVDVNVGEVVFLAM